MNRSKANAEAEATAIAKANATVLLAQMTKLSEFLIFDHFYSFVQRTKQ